MDIKEVLNGNIFKVWAKFIIASVVGVVLNTIYTMVDGIFIGQGVGEVGLAGINIAWPAVTLVVGIGLMIGIGTSSIIAIYMGKGENKKAEKVLGTGVTLIVCIGVVVTILGLLFRMPIIKLLGATSDTLESALDYYTIIFIIAVPYIFATALNPIVRTDGRPDLSMIMIGIGAIANIVLDWILVMKLGFGVKGAAIATSASILISMSVSLYHFIKGKATIKVKKENLKIHMEIVKRILKIGFVSFTIQISYGIILLTQNRTILIYTSILLFGREMIAIFGVSSEYIESAYEMIRIYCIGSPAIGTIFTISGYYQAIGKNTYANIISIGRGFVFQFIFTLALPPFIGTTGVFLSLPLAELITMMIIVGIIVIDRKNSSLELIENY